MVGSVPQDPIFKAKAGQASSSCLKKNPEKDLVDAAQQGVELAQLLISGENLTYEQILMRFYGNLFFGTGKTTATIVDAKITDNGLENNKVDIPVDTTKKK